MNFTEFNESVNTRLDDLSELSDKYNIFNESVAEQLKINIEKAKLYVAESHGNDEDLAYLISEAEKEASEKFASSLNKLQRATSDTFNSIAEDLSKFADSAKLAVGLDKLKKNKEVADKKVDINLSYTKDLDKVRSDVLAKLAVLKVNINATISAQEFDKLDKVIKDAIENLNKMGMDVSINGVQAIDLYQKKLDEIKNEVSAAKEISKKMDGISGGDDWDKRSGENKSQIGKLQNKLTSLMNKKVSALKSDLSKLSSSIKAPKSDMIDVKVRKESVKVNVSDILNNIIEEKAKEINTVVENVSNEPDEADKILAEIEASITESENNEINDIEEVTFDESTNVDDVVSELLSELI